MKTSREDREFIALRYDDLLLSEARAMPLAEVRELLLPDVVELLSARDRSIEAEAESLIAASLATVREGRRNNLRRDLEYILDYWIDPTNGAIGIEAIFPKAYPLGTQNGEDKTLAMWTIEDLTGAIMGRYREASDAMRAAREFDDAAQRVATEMVKSGALHIGDVRPVLDAA